MNSVTLPDSIKHISDGAFIGCSSLLDIYVDENNPKCSSKDGLLLNKDMTELILCPEEKSGSLIIPQGVKAIPGFCKGCTDITSITIP